MTRSLSEITTIVVWIHLMKRMQRIY